METVSLKIRDDLIERDSKEAIPVPERNTSGTCRGDLTGEEIQLNANSKWYFRNATDLQTGWADLPVRLSKPQPEMQPNSYQHR
jgi:hypothetical protein